VKKKIKDVKYLGRLAKNIIIDMISKDIKLYNIEALPFDKKNHITAYIITKKEPDYD
jgi:hypothetical protein